MTDHRAIDPGALARLEEWGGEKLVAQMVRLFLKNAGARMDQIRAGVLDGNIQEAERGAHSLKSSAANIGAERLRALTGQVEASAGAGDQESVVRLLPELEEAFTNVMTELASIERGFPE